MSRRLLLLIIGAILLIGGGLWFLYTGRSQAVFERPKPEEAKKAAAVLSVDRDNDGLKDWEEELWHTDPLREDSDDDGTDDGDEIKLGRNPAKEGPDDALDVETIESKTVPGGGNWTETDRVSRELFARFLEMRQSGEPFTAEDEEALLNELLARYPEQRSVKTYTAEDLKRGGRDDTDAWRAYGQSLGKVLQSYADPKAESEMIIFERALENEDEIDLAHLSKRAKRYEAILSNVSAIAVPESLLPPAVRLANALEALREATEGMAAAFTDPVETLSAATSYPKAVDELIGAFDDFTAFYDEKSIVYEAEEPGYLVTH